jgi:hypothetical protein
VFGLVDLVKIRENGTVFSEKGRYLKKCLYEDHTVFDPMPISEGVSKFSENLSDN